MVDFLYEETIKLNLHEVDNNLKRNSMVPETILRKIYQKRIR